MLVAFSNVKPNHYTPHVASGSNVIKSKEYIRILQKDKSFESVLGGYLSMMNVVYQSDSIGNDLRNQNVSIRWTEGGSHWRLSRSTS
jgi:hypothetical protein